MDYPQRLEDVFYGLQKQEPSYRSEFPNDLPFDPGATSSIFELNYFPSTASRLLLVIPLLLVLVLVLYRKQIRTDLGQVGFIAAMALVFFGPLRLPSFFPFNTALGLVKAIGILLAGYAALSYLFRKIRCDILDMPSLPQVGVYVVSLLLSVFVMTNPTFFFVDFTIAISGIVFFFLGYAFFTWQTGRLLLTLWARLLFIAGSIVLFIFVSRGAGVEMVSLLFPRYENFVFLHDLSRGRIFSVIDFEYFIPAVAVLLTVGRRPRSNRIALAQLYVVTAVSFVAILLVNYRYRFLTYVLGLFSISAFTKRYAPAIRKAITQVVVGLGVLYFIVSFMTYKSTILDRFLVRNYAEDRVSIDRRFVMYRQAWDLFIQHPILGVGLGNYKDNVQIVYSRFGGRTYEPYYKILQNVYAYPHNWFLTVLAENGIVGFAVLLWMLWSFFIMDMRLYRTYTGDALVVFVAVSAISWLWVFANLFTMMHVSLPTVIVFWACRGMIERMAILKPEPMTALKESFGR